MQHVLVDGRWLMRDRVRTDPAVHALAGVRAILFLDDGGFEPPPALELESVDEALPPLEDSGLELEPAEPDSRQRVDVQLEDGNGNIVDLVGYGVVTCANRPTNMPSRAMGSSEAWMREAVSSSAAGAGSAIVTDAFDVSVSPYTVLLPVLLKN